jgi:hypothetical protein
MPKTSDLSRASTHDLLTCTAIGHLATIRPDGTPQSNPVWFEWDGEHIKMSTTKARQKYHNLEREPRGALSVTDPDNPYRYLEVRGVVDHFEDDPGYAFIDHLSERYMGKRPYPYHQPGDERVTIYLRPTGLSALAA